MARSGSPSGGRPFVVPWWLPPLAALVAVPLVVLLAGAVAAWLLSGDTGTAVAVCGVVAAFLVLGEGARGARTADMLRSRHAAEQEALKGHLEAHMGETFRLATQLLPAAVERLQQGALVDEALSGLTPHPRLGPELGAAHEAVLRSVIDAVEAQEGLRDSAQRAFVNIARRVQAIVHQQAVDLREMEDRHGTNREVYDDLLHLDHGTALVGRLADSIAVLGGARPGRQWRLDVPLFNVLRGAMSRIIDYDRVDLHSVAEFAVVGPAVEPLIHALAELLDNATRYSPPHARVHLTATEVHAGVAVEIEDAGIGLTDEARVRAERALARAASGSAGLDLDDLGETPRLGLAVVGRLAWVNHFTVALRPSVYGGVRAVLTVPKDLLTVSPVPGGQIARAGSVPSLRPRAAQPPTGPSGVSAPEVAESFSRGANGLPQRRRRSAPVSAGAQPPGAARAGARPAGTDASRSSRGKEESGSMEPGMWLADFHDGISGKLLPNDAEDAQNGPSSGEDE
ncbi:ATP-binding protein [Actinomadura sp. 9N407]|uniref:ATP-binding protein n=1 Tax=Actinomadura sp. 9N407 TaxID=3375154 RepID=UPI0037B48994